jgi:hypothetical protein
VELERTADDIARAVGENKKKLASENPTEANAVMLETLQKKRFSIDATFA